MGFPSERSYYLSKIPVMNKGPGINHDIHEIQFASVFSVTVTPNIGSPTLPGELLTGAT